MLTVAQLAEALGAEVRGNADHSITGLGTLEGAIPSQLAFLANKRYAGQLAETQAGAVLLAAEHADSCPATALVISDPYLAFAKASQFFQVAPIAEPGIHPSASVAEPHLLPENISIGANVVVEAGVRLGEGTVISANVTIGANCQLGQSCRIWPGVVLYHGVTMGDRCTVHANTVIGSDGFGFAFNGAGWTKLHQVGGVSIGNDVEIGANTTIDRGAIEDTVISNGVILDNQIQIAHNVVIGEHTAIASKVGISGSSKIGAYCMLAGAVGVAGHLEICDKVQVLGMSMVTSSITTPGVYGSGLPADDHRRYRKNVARFRNLDELARRVKKLENNTR